MAVMLAVPIERDSVAVRLAPIRTQQRHLHYHDFLESMVAAAEHGINRVATAARSQLQILN